MKTFLIVFLGCCFASSVQIFGKNASISNAADTTGSFQLKKYNTQSDKFFKAAQYDSLILIIQKGLPLAERLGDSLSMGRYRNRLGLYHSSKHDYQTALENIGQAIEIFKRKNEVIYQSRAMYSRAMVTAGSGKRETAIRICFENLKFAEKHHITDVLMNNYGLLEFLFEKLNDSKRTEIFRSQYFAHLKDTKNPILQAIGFEMLAKSHEEKGNYKAAWPFWEAFLKGSREIKPVSLQINCLVRMAENLRKRTLLVQALPYLKQARQLSVETNDTIQISFIDRENSFIQLDLKKDIKALDLAKKAAAIVKKTNNADETLPALEDLVYIQQQTGHYKEAFETLTEITAKKDSLFNQERLKIVAQANAEYDLEKKESKILLLNKDVRLQRLLAQQRRSKLDASNQKIYFLVIGVVLLSVLVLFVAYSYYQSQKLRKQLSRQQDALKVQSEKLEDSNLFKDRMFSLLSHDLRNPVGSLKASLALLQSGKQKTVEYVGFFEEQVDFLQHTLDNVLYWSLSQQKSIPIMPQVTDLHEIINEVVDSLRGLILIKHIKLVVHQGSAILKADEQLLIIVLRNIIHNAIKFTPENGSIAITAASDKTGTQIRINDTGPGLDLTADMAKKSRKQGTGLGLNLSRDLMKRNGGVLKIESQAGAGTTVILSWMKTKEPA